MKLLNLSIFIILSSFLVTSGCVSSGKFKKLEGDLAKYRELLEKSENEKKELMGSMSEIRQALDEMKERTAEAKKRIADYQSLFWKLKKFIDEGKLRLKLVDGRMVVVLPSDVLFPSGAYMLSPRGLAAIKEIAPVLISLEDKKFQVEGHTDNIPIKTYKHPTNWELASDRALNVLHALVQEGMPPERISGTSYGPSRPLQPNNSIAGQMANRRIEIVIVPDLTSLPGYKELKDMTEKRENAQEIIQGQIDSKNEPEHKNPDAEREKDNP